MGMIDSIVLFFHLRMSSFRAIIIITGVVVMVILKLLASSLQYRLYLATLIDKQDSERLLLSHGRFLRSHNTLLNRNNNNNNDVKRLQRTVMMASLAYSEQLYNCIPTSPLNKIESFFKAPEEGGYKSQSNEDIWLYRQIFSKLSNQEVMGGYFVELGALDGLQFSNTWLFEKHFDWRGILIEGHPDNALKLRQNGPLRPNAAIFTNSICSEPPHKLFHHVTFSSSGDAIGTTKEHSKPQFIFNWHPDPNTFSKGKNVTCFPMQYILELTGVLDIQLLSLDVEGAELAVLETINFNVTNIRVLLIEMDGLDARQDESIRSFLRQHHFMDAFTAGLGNIRNACGSNDSFVETPSPEAIAALNITYRPFGGCTKNEVFINPHFESRKVERSKQFRFNRYFVNGTGVPC